MDDYEPWLTPCDLDFDPEKCESAYALWAVKEEGEPVNRQAHRGRMGRGWRYLPCRLCRGHGAPRRRRLR